MKVIVIGDNKQFPTALATIHNVAGADAVIIPITDYEKVKEKIANERAMKKIIQLAKLVPDIK